MSVYRPGVLIHNYNEDRFGTELVAQRLAGKKFQDEKYVSMSRIAFQDPAKVAKDMVRACFVLSFKTAIFSHDNSVLGCFLKSEKTAIERNRKNMTSKSAPLGIRHVERPRPLRSVSHIGIPNSGNMVNASAANRRLSAQDVSEGNIFSKFINLFSPHL